MALHSIKSFTIIINHNGENLCTQVSLKIYAVLSCQNKKKVRNIFIVHGEDPSREAYSHHLAEAGFTKTFIPKFRESVEI